MNERGDGPRRAGSGASARRLLHGGRQPGKHGAAPALSGGDRGEERRVFQVLGVQALDRGLGELGLDGRRAHVFLGLGVRVEAQAVEQTAQARGLALPVAAVDAEPAADRGVVGHRGIEQAPGLSVLAFFKRVLGADQALEGPARVAVGPIRGEAIAQRDAL